MAKFKSHNGMYKKKRRPLEHSEFKWFRKTETEKHFERGWPTFVWWPKMGAWTELRVEEVVGKTRRSWTHLWPTFTTPTDFSTQRCFADAASSSKPSRSPISCPPTPRKKPVTPSYYATFYYDRFVPGLFLDTFLLIWVGLFSKSFPQHLFKFLTHFYIVKTLFA